MYSISFKELYPRLVGYSSPHYTLLIGRSSSWLKVVIRPSTSWRRASRDLCLLYLITCGSLPRVLSLSSSPWHLYCVVLYLVVHSRGIWYNLKACIFWKYPIPTISLHFLGLGYRQVSYKEVNWVFIGVNPYEPCPPIKWEWYLGWAYRVNSSTYRHFLKMPDSSLWQSHFKLRPDWSITFLLINDKMTPVACFRLTEP